MKLKRYLDEAGQTVERFAARIGVSAPTIYRYISGDRIPNREVMARIVSETNGAVQPNDFYDLEEAPEEAEAA